MPTAAKIDLGKLHKADYVAPKQPVLLHIAPARYLAVTGQGRPGGDEFQTRIGALYAIAFTVKMTRKFGGRQDYTVGRLEAQYFFDGDPAAIPPDEWPWRLLIRTPEFVADTELTEAAAKLIAKGKPAEVKQVKLETIDEGRCVQMLNVGPYEREGDSVAVMCAFAGRHGLKFAGPHHEIYISDPRRVAPAKLKTILRLPVAPA